MHQIVCILKDKSIGVIKITYGHHPPCIRKAISGTFLSRSTTYISKLDEGINSNPFPHENYGQGHHIGSTWGSSLKK